MIGSPTSMHRLSWIPLALSVLHVGASATPLPADPLERRCMPEAYKAPISAPALQPTTRSGTRP
jgi:hypothetical protein